MIDAWMITIAFWAIVAFVAVLIPIGAILAAEQAVRAAQALLAWRRRRYQALEDDILRAIKEAGYRAFDEHAGTALRIVAQAQDWDEALERLTTQEGTDQ